MIPQLPLAQHAIWSLLLAGTERVAEPVQKRVEIVVFDNEHPLVRMRAVELGGPVQRDLTVAWSERHYWRLPEGYLAPIPTPVVTVSSDSIEKFRVDAR